MNGIYNPHSGIGSPDNVLMSARQYLIEYGWTRRFFYDHSTDQLFPPASVFGAIGIALTGTPNLTGDQLASDAADAMATSVKVLATYLNEGGRFNFFAALDYLANWHADPDLTFDEVIWQLRWAAEEYDWTHRVCVVL